MTSQKAAAAGGFVGVRTRALAPPLDLRGAEGLELRVRPAGGGPQRFKCRRREWRGWQRRTQAEVQCFRTQGSLGSLRGVQFLRSW